MEKEQLHEIHESTWKDVADVLPNNLNASYLFVGEIDDAYTDFNHSLTGKDERIHVEQAAVPSSIRFVAAENITNFMISFGGILMPTNCLDDNVSETTIGLVHEQVHEVLSGLSLVYGLYGLFNNINQRLSYHFEQFTELMAHGYTSKVLEKQGVSIRDYFRTSVLIYNPRAREFYGITENPYTFEEELELTIKDQEDYLNKIDGHDPISEFGLCLEEYLGLFVEESSERELCRSALTQLANSNYSVKRRIFDGSWEDVNPII